MDTIVSRESILRLRDVKARTGLSRSTIYLKIAERTFPEPITLGARSVGWIASEIDAWIAQRIEQSRRTRPDLRSGDSI